MTSFGTTNYYLWDTEKGVIHGPFDKQEDIKIDYSDNSFKLFQEVTKIIQQHVKIVVDFDKKSVTIDGAPCLTLGGFEYLEGVSDIIYTNFDTFINDCAKAAESFIVIGEPDIQGDKLL